MGARRILLLDVMGTLVRDPFYDEMPRFFGVDMRTLLRLKHPTAWLELERGEIDDTVLATRFFADGRAIDVDALKRAMHAAYAWNPGIEPLLAELRARGVEMHVLSNYPQWYRLVEDRLALSRYAPWTFVSCEIGARKPDDAAYSAVTRTLGVAPTACTLIDDRPENCAGARRFGMDAHVYTDAADLWAALRERGFL
jgi:HAD superfamily hydrolase (TIGR01509 family)